MTCPHCKKEMKVTRAVSRLGYKCSHYKCTKCVYEGTKLDTEDNETFITQNKKSSKSFL